MANRQYVGARYVPKFADPVEWNSALSYESLTIVTHLGNSFTSKKPVPAGVDIGNTEYWVNTGNYNEQVEEYKQVTESAVKKTAGIKGYGGIGDGVTNDTAAFNAMLTDVGYVYLPKGNYLLDPITIKQTANIYGDGYESILLIDSFVIDAYFCTIKNLTFKARKQSSGGVQLTKSFCTVKNVQVLDEDNSFAKAISVGDVGKGAWNNIIDNVYINSSGNGDKTGDGLVLTSAVNCLFSNITIYNKDTAIKMNSDKTAGYSIDGAQFVNINVLQCNNGISAKSCSSVSVVGSIFDQIINLGANINDCTTFTFNSCYMSSAPSSPVSYKAAELFKCKECSFIGCRFGANANTYGVTLDMCTNVVIDSTSFGTFVNGINVSETCEHIIVDKCCFDDLVTNKIENQCDTLNYYNLSGGGIVKVYAGTYTYTLNGQLSDTFTPTEGNNYYDRTVPLPEKSKGSLIIGVPKNNSFPIITTFLGNDVCRVTKLDGDWDGNTSVSIVWVYSK